MNLGEEYLVTSIRRFRYYKDLGDKTLSQLSETDLHFRPNETSNSIAIIVQHMTGNMLSRWTNFLTEDGEKEWRQRDEEFEIHAFTKQALIELWEKGWNCLFEALESLSDEDLLKNVFIRQEALTVIDAINRQLAHYPYHIGQLVYIGKLLKDEQWKNLSIPKGQSVQYNTGQDIKDPAKKF
ncbi:MAG TPA: DUF1572 family protein [Chitinophagaceae bacterium]|nr:DUF1572 family protein [Chitinophagaceae bacterium]